MGLLFVGVLIRLDLDPGDDLPEIVIALDDAAERRHRRDDVLDRLAGKALGLEILRAEGDEAEQSVVGIAVDPDAVRDRRAHAAAAAAAVATGAAVPGENLLTFLGELLVVAGFLGRVRVLERSLGGSLSGSEGRTRCTRDCGSSRRRLRLAYERTAL